MNRALAEPAGLRGEAERRRRVARGVVIAAAALGVGLAGGTAVALARPLPITTPPVGTTSTTPVPGSPSPSSSTSSSPSSSPSPSGSPAEEPRAAGGDCRPDDFDPRPTYGGGAAAGTAGSYVVVRNVSATSCVLRVDPALYQAGGARPLPARRTGSGPSDATVAPGGYAAFLILTTNGYGGYSPTAPECQHPQDYRDLSVGLAGGRRFPLPGFEVGYQCGDLRIGDWMPVHDVSTEIPNPRRAP